MKKILFLGILLISKLGISQTLSSSLSKQKIDLGEPIQMKINITNLKGKNVVSAQKNALLPFNFEENKDEININDNQYIRTIDFTIFDEGKHLIPALEFKVGDEILYTVPYEIEVFNSAQPNENINDILPNEDVSLSISDHWEMYKVYLFGTLAILGVLGFGLIFWLNRKIGKIKNTRVQNPAVKYLKKIEELHNKNLIDKNEYRLFYIELVDICREYLVEHYHIPADVLLTEDLADFLKNKSYFPKENLVILEVITRGDLVKFAKIIPDKNAMESDLQEIKNLIQTSHFKQ